MVAVRQGNLEPSVQLADAQKDCATSDARLASSSCYRRSMSTKCQQQRRTSHNACRPVWRSAAINLRKRCSSRKHRRLGQHLVYRLTKTSLRQPCMHILLQQTPNTITSATGEAGRLNTRGHSIVIHLKLLMLTDLSARRCLLLRGDSTKSNGATGWIPRDCVCRLIDGCLPYIGGRQTPVLHGQTQRPNKTQVPKNEGAQQTHGGHTCVHRPLCFCSEWPVLPAVSGDLQLVGRSSRYCRF
jgi:hypothetical protein